MKLQTLMIAMALAAGTAFAQAPNGSSSASTAAYGTKASVSADVKTTDQVAPKVHKKHVAKKHALKHHAKAKHHELQAKAKHHEMHAKAKHHEMHAKAKHHELHAKAHQRHHHLQASAHVQHLHTQAMGAGPAVTATDLNARARQARMDQAYAQWRATQARR